MFQTTYWWKIWIRVNKRSAASNILEWAASVLWVMDGHQYLCCLHEPQQRPKWHAALQVHQSIAVCCRLDLVVLGAVLCTGVELETRNPPHAEVELETITSAGTHKRRRLLHANSRSLRGGVIRSSTNCNRLGIQYITIVFKSANMLLYLAL